MRKLLKTLVLIQLLFGLSCSFSENRIGTLERPIRFWVLAPQNTTQFKQSALALKNYLEKKTPYKFKLINAPQAEDILNAFGKDQVDVAFLNTYGYFQAHQKYGAQAKLTVLRNGVSTYQSALITRKDRGLKKLKDLNGKKIAFVDALSASGYLVPTHILNQKHVQISQKVFAANHEAVVRLVYQGKVDSGAIFYTETAEGQIEDARKLVRKEFPDVYEKVVVIEKSEPIPNDPVVFSRAFPEEIQDKISNTLIEFSQDPIGRTSLEQTTGATYFKKSTDLDYESVINSFINEQK